MSPLTGFVQEITGCVSHTAWLSPHFGGHSILQQHTQLVRPMSTPAHATWPQVWQVRTKP